MKRETVETVCFLAFILLAFAMYCVFGALDGGASLWCGLWLIPIIGLMGLVALWLEYDGYIRNRRRRRK